MESCCPFKALVGGVCGYDPKDRKRDSEIVPLLSCDKDINRHKSLYKFTGPEDEVELILCRAATTSFPGSTPLSRWRRREDPGTHRYDTHVDWSEDIDILRLVVIGQNCLPCEMTYLCSCICHFLCNLERNYRRFNIPRVVLTIHGN